MTYNSYSCLPVVDPDSGDPMSNAGGSEFIISARGSVALDYELEAAEGLVQAAVAEVVQAIQEGAI